MCCGKAQSGREKLTWRVQAPGACSYDASVPNRGETPWTGPLGFNSPVYKPHYSRKVKSFYNESAHETSQGTVDAQRASNPDIYDMKM